MTRFVSNSEIQTWKDCRRRWKWQYRDRLVRRRENPTGAAAVGTRVHSALEMYYGGASEFEVMQDMEDQIAHDLAANADAPWWRDLDNETDLARAIVTGYFEWLDESGADHGLTVVAPEAILEAEMPVGYGNGEQVWIRGKIDVRVRNEGDGSRMVLDHKTVGNFTDPLRGLFLDEQVKMYLTLERLNDPNARTDGAIYNMLRKSKRTARATPPFYQRAEARHNRRVLDEFFVRLCAEVSEIVRAEEAPEASLFPRPTRDCHWKCPFYAVCALYDEDPSRANERIEELYEVGDPDARYDNKEKDA